MWCLVGLELEDRASGVFRAKDGCWVLSGQSNVEADAGSDRPQPSTLCHPNGVLPPGLKLAVRSVYVEVRV